jgi:fluoride ion exporter CrcB/FEX
MIKYLLIVGVGSFFGGVLRYYISSLMKNIISKIRQVLFGDTYVLKRANAR